MFGWFSFVEFVKKQWNQSVLLVLPIVEFKPVFALLPRSTSDVYFGGNSSSFHQTVEICPVTCNPFKRHKDIHKPENITSLMGVML